MVHGYEDDIMTRSVVTPVMGIVVESLEDVQL